MMKKNKKIVVIGGGTGIFPVTTALRHLDNIDISTIISVSDNGGSTGRIRDEFGFQPVGDLRQSLAALAEAENEEWIRKLLLYRFEKGQGLKGHNLGNLILTALQDMTSNTSEALFRVKQIFRLKGEVIPATNENVQLKIIYQDGTELVGEKHLDNDQNDKKIDQIELLPQATVNPYAVEAILSADLIIIGPGDYYASILAALAPVGMDQALQRSTGKILYISNLMTRLTQTKDMTARDHVGKLEESIGKKIDFILINSQDIPTRILDKYQQSNEFPVQDDLVGDDRVLRFDIISSKMNSKSYQDDTHRELLRHDSNKLQAVIEKIINKL